VRAKSATPQVSSSDPDDGPPTPRPERPSKKSRNAPIFGTPEDESEDEEDQLEETAMDVDTTNEKGITMPRTSSIVAREIRQKKVVSLPQDEVAETASQSSVATDDEALGGPETQALVTDALLYKSPRRHTRQQQEVSEKAGATGRTTRRSAQVGSSVDTCVAVLLSLFTTLMGCIGLRQSQPAKW
jgi:hypothetical protein